VVPHPPLGKDWIGRGRVKKKKKKQKANATRPPTVSIRPEDHQTKGGAERRVRKGGRR